MAFTFNDLPYGYDALEPHFDKMTMEIHYSRHHNGYFTKFTNAIEGTDLANSSLEDIFANISKHGAGIRNNGGGFYNHNIFWNSLSPEGGGTPSGELGDAITAKWGSFDKFKEEFSTKAAGNFGSGWTWLIEDGGKLDIMNTSNADTPMNHGKKALLTIDVWEHAYYIDYRNARPKFIENFWNLVNWDFVNSNL